MKKVLLEVAIVLAVALVIFFALRTTVKAYRISETCMVPNYVEGEWVLASKASYWFGEPERGDVIILWPPFPSSAPYIKRLIGLPGDTVEVKGGVVYVNGIALDEPYIKEAPAYTFPLTELGDDEYFVLADNRNNANDSHVWGTLPRDNIIGKAWFTYWPTSEWSGDNSYPLEDQLEVAAE